MAFPKQSCRQNIGLRNGIFKQQKAHYTGTEGLNRIWPAACRLCFIFCLAHNNGVLMTLWGGLKLFPMNHQGGLRITQNRPFPTRTRTWSVSFAPFDIWVAITYFMSSSDKAHQKHSPSPKALWQWSYCPAWGHREGLIHLNELIAPCRGIKSFSLSLSPASLETGS